MTTRICGRKIEWTYKVYAFNRYGNSRTTTAELTIETNEADDPTPPDNLFALQAMDGPKVNLYWTAPDDGGQDIDVLPCRGVGHEQQVA